MVGVRPYDSGSARRSPPFCRLAGPLREFLQLIVVRKRCDLPSQLPTPVAD